MRFSTPLTVLIVTAAALLTLLLPTTTARAQTRVFDITLENLTNPAPNSGQPFSPPVFFTHDAATATPWTLGETASFPVQQVAEEGDNGPLLADLATQRGGSVGDVQTPTGAAPLLPGQSVSLVLVADASHPFLSALWMLGRTNDGFSGVAGLDLFGPGAAALGTFDLIALDAGTEVNNELAAFLPALGGILNDPERGVIAAHPGLSGGGDAPASWGFTNPVARLTITARAPASAIPEPGTLALLIVAAVPRAFLIRRRAACGIHE